MNRVMMKLSENPRISNQEVNLVVNRIKEIEVKVDNIEKDIVDIKGLLGKILEKVDK
jgi:hypothetical protein